MQRVRRRSRVRRLLWVVHDAPDLARELFGPAAVALADSREPRANRGLGGLSAPPRGLVRLGVPAIGFERRELRGDVVESFSPALERDVTARAFAAPQRVSGPAVPARRES